MKHVLITAAVACTFFAGAVSANTADTIAAQCAAQTGSQGSFTVSTSGPVPSVTPGEGASSAGARNVNDCIYDKYKVQFDSADGMAVASAASTERSWVFYRRSCPGGVLRGGVGYCFER